MKSKILKSIIKIKKIYKLSDKEDKIYIGKILSGDIKQ